MTWFDYFLPLLIPVAAIAVIVYALWFERPRRAKAAAKATEKVTKKATAKVRPEPLAPVHPADDTPQGALARLEAIPGPPDAGSDAGPDAGPDAGSDADTALSSLNDWLRVVVDRGGPGDLARLARIDPAVLAPLGNTPARLFTAIQRSDGAVQAALTAQRNEVLEIAARQAISGWKEAARDIDGLDPLSDQIEGWVSTAAPGVLSTILADIEANAADQRWQILRLYVAGWIPEFHPEHPGGAATKAWLIHGLMSRHAPLLRAAIDVFPDLAGDHRFDPTGDEAAALRDRAIALATGGLEDLGLALDRSLAEALGEGLAAVTGLQTGDAGPVDVAASAALATAVAPQTDADFWEAARDLQRRGSALLGPLGFAAKAMETAPDHRVVAGAAWLILREESGRLRRLARPDAEANAIARALLKDAPADVVTPLIAALDGPEAYLPGWPNPVALALAAARPDLPASLIERIKTLGAPDGVGGQ